MSRISQTFREISRNSPRGETIFEKEITKTLQLFIYRYIYIYIYIYNLKLFRQSFVNVACFTKLSRNFKRGNNFRKTNRRTFYAKFLRTFCGVAPFMRCLRMFRELRPSAPMSGRTRPPERRGRAAPRRRRPSGAARSRPRRAPRSACRGEFASRFVWKIVSNFLLLLFRFFTKSTCQGV